MAQTTFKFRVIKDSSIYNNTKCSSYGDDVLMVDTSGGIYLGNNTSAPNLIANVSNIQAVDTGDTIDDVNIEYATKEELAQKQDIISDIDNIRSGAAKGATALQSYTEQYKGTVTGVTINGTTKNPSNGVVDLGTVITEHQDISSKQDKLVSGTNIKTINGESILGSGDITISGGSSSGGAYAEVSHGTSDTTFTLTPNVFHVWDEVTELNITLDSEISGVANEYLFQFTSGSEPTALTLPDDIKWANDSAPTIAENMIYQVSILKGLASVLEFSNAAILIENHITYNEGDLMNGGTITFEYPTASELTLNMSYYHSSTLIVPQGSTQVNVDWNEPSAPVIRGVSPTEDSTYKYIL